MFTLRGRLGYEVPLRWPTLFYVTGGMAVTQLKVNNSYSDNSAFGGIGASSFSNNQIGWTAGLGLELLAYDNLSVDLEYSYVHVPSVSTTSTISNTQGGFGIPAQSLISPFSTNASFHASLLKLGVNYRFSE